ncbi:nucleotide exchange factor GrpE [Candidatus Poriferisodalis sp.]|uniref:nucleotide exchange factor GrpE n=1 Tax=Candidatus Poriferisodalis sp. TaxID=3101277 RepID=UPI003B027AFC
MSEPETELDAAAAEAVGESPEDLEDLAERADLLPQLEAVMAERDDYLDQLQRQRAEFQNYRKRVEAERRQQVAAGVSRLVESLLPVLDGCDAATAQGHDEVAAVGQSLMVALGKAGLERIDSVGEPFDPTQHEAVTIEEAVDDAPQIVAAELRSGFRFDGRVLRAAMVQVRAG